jgi:uncharacterized membrane protein YbaN (DUF454 family)
LRAKLKRIIILGLGWVFLLLGIAGLFLPFLQGILFILIGLYLLSRASPRVERFLNRVKERYPALRKFDEARERAENLLKQVFRKKR